MAFTASAIPDIGPGSRTVRFKSDDFRSMESIHLAAAVLTRDGIPAIVKYRGGRPYIDVRYGELVTTHNDFTGEIVFHWIPDLDLPLNKSYSAIDDIDDLPF